MRLKSLFILSIIILLSSCSKSKSSSNQQKSPIIPASINSIDDIKNIIESKRELINSMFAVVRPLEVPSFDISEHRKMNEEDCLNLKEQIKASYKNVDPFSQKHDSGSTTFDLCRGTDFKIVKSDYKTVLGADANTLFQKTIFDYDTRTTQSILLSSDMTILQISDQVFDRVRNQGLVESTIQLRDVSGAYYEKNVISHLSTQSGFLGPQTRLVVSSADGEIVRAIEIRHQNLNDSAKTIVRTQEQIATAKDWYERILTATQGWMGGYYMYEDTLLNKPKNYVNLYSIINSGDPICDQATVWQNKKPVESFPEDAEKRNFCNNYRY